MSSAYNLCFWWNLIYVERCIADFYITDIRSGARVLVKVSSDSKISPLVTESLIVKTSSRKKELSSTLKKWLEERHLSSESRLLCLKEGYIMEGSYLTVMGMLIRKSGVLTIVPPPEPISTGCLLGKFLLPIDVNGLVLRYLYRDDSSLSSSVSNQADNADSVLC
ncbi:uncharacterized protein A4U43_C04F22380 [Asparagus officinalis]|uniref:Uncharacterized protein n=1 Tax=Asparagus officinalis TaxID=4686 RepID=A0A5P1F2Y0_ASPOF|nr:uncharacterized protein A4U43_C04F22380 [Asparagus officinalis]